MSTRHCEECGAVLDPVKVLRCIKCKACFYCSAACQKRNWRLHKRVCTTDHLLRPFIRVEMAIERTKGKQREVQAPRDAFCYICLDGEDEGSSKLMRGCACRGDSAGFVHLECLTQLAVSKEVSRDPQVVFDGWIKCGNCKQFFEGALDLEMRRRFWRHYRSSQDLDLRYNSTRELAAFLGFNGEIDAVNKLLDEASTVVANGEQLLALKLVRAEVLIRNGQMLEALGLLQAMLPEAEVFTAKPRLYGLTMQQTIDVLLDLNRNQEAHEKATELVAWTKAKFGLEDPHTLTAVRIYAGTCARLGRFEEAKATFEDTLTTQTRVLGRDHPYTQSTVTDMRNIGFAVPSG